jgi:hypothetical protein
MIASPLLVARKTPRPPWSSTFNLFLPLALAFALGCGATSKKEAKEPSTVGELLPACPPAEPPAFPPDSEGAAFRAWVALKVVKDGKATDLCYQRVEVRGGTEEKAMADRHDWTFPLEHAGQRRERIVVYRLTPSDQK